MMRRDWLRRATRFVAATVVMALGAGGLTPAFAYLKFGYQINGRSFTLKWTTASVRYYLNEAGVPGVTPAAFEAAVGRAFDTWEEVPTASVTYQFGGFTRSRPGEDDGRSTLGFLNEPSFDRVLASTSYLIDNVTGELIESDIFFNSAFDWSVAEQGERGRWDLESIAVHEIGHLSGLGHSAIGETELVQDGGRRVLSTAAAMFPIALGMGDVSGRNLRPDDIAGLSDLYPADGLTTRTGSISGVVTRDGHGLLGAHVVAVDVASGNMVANFSLTTEGQFSIAGLTPGPHIVRVEPLDDVDVDSFFDSSDPIDVDFRVRYYDRLVIVPRGGDSGTVTIAVVPK